MMIKFIFFRIFDEIGNWLNTSKQYAHQLKNNKEWWESKNIKYWYQLDNYQIIKVLVQSNFIRNQIIDCLDEDLFTADYKLLFRIIKQYTLKQPEIELTMELLKKTLHEYRDWLWERNLDREHLF